jgi:methionyl-tRNA formyltransferase
MTKARILFMGTPDFAVESLQKLVQQRYDILVVTQPDKPAGRKKTLTPPPVKEAALSLGLPVMQPVKVRDNDALNQIAAFKPDVLVTAAYGQLLPQKLLDIPRVGPLNVHASLLPRWRGAAPIHRAILSGDAETGVSIMEMVKALDAGPVIGMEKTPIHLTDTVGTLHDRLAKIGADLLVRLLPDYMSGSMKAIPQTEDGVTYAERIVRADEFIDFKGTTMQVYNHVRGLSPWPGAVVKFKDSLLKIWAAKPFDNKIETESGATSQLDDSTVIVQCADGRLQLLELQPAGKRKMTASEWMRGIQEMPIRLESARSE